MRSKTFFYLLALALAPLFRADADDLLLAQTTKVPIVSRPTRPGTPMRAHVSTNFATTNATVSTNANIGTNSALGKPFGATTPSKTGGATTSGAANMPFPAFPTSSLPGAAGVKSPVANGQPGAIVNPDDVPSLEYNYIATPIEQVLDDYADLVNRTILRANVGSALVAPGTLISLKTRPGHKLSRRQAIAALEAVLGMNGIGVVPIGDEFLKVVPDAVVGQQGAAFNTTDSAHIPEVGRFITQIVQLKYATQDITQALQPFSKSPNSIIFIPSTQTLVLRDYAENVKRMMEIVEKIDVSSPMVVKPKVIPIKYALASDIANALSSLSGGGGGTVSVGSHQAGGGLGASRGFGSGGIGGGAGGVGGMGGTGTYGPGGSTTGSPYGGTTGGTSGLASPGTTTRSSFQNNLANIIRKAASSGGPGGGGDFQILGTTKIIADERTNSLLVFANDEDMAMIELIVSKLDVVLAQVLIEAIIVDVTLTKNRSMSVSYLTSGSAANGKLAGGVNNLSQSASTFLNGVGTISQGSNDVSLTNPRTGLPSGLSFIGNFNNFDVAVEMLESDSRATILSRPRIQTSHAVPAMLFNGQTIPYITGSYYGGYNGGLGSSQYTEKEIGISLEVLPLINPDGLVVMDIRQNIEEVTGNTTIDNNPVPITSKRQAEAKVAVKDRETIILGGFIRSSKSKSNSGVPFLKDIPGLGVLFRSSNNDSQQDELIVLIRPTVLPTPEVASKFATEERARLSGVKQGERDLRVEEEERYRKIEEQLRKDDEIRKARELRDAKHNARLQHQTDAYQYENGTSYMTNKPVTTPDL